MAIRLNTVEYAFPQIITTQAAGVVGNFSQIVVEIPELTNRSFVSAFADVTVMDQQAAAASPTSFSFGIRCSSYGGQGTFLNQTLTTTVANSGEHMSYHLLFDVSSQFINNFKTTNASYVIDASFAVAVNATNNKACKLVLTYEYDDSASARVKTVRIPLESSTGSLNHILNSIKGMGDGGYDIPALDTFLPEASKAYKDIFFESWTNESALLATVQNPSLGWSLDAEAADYDGSHNSTLISARLIRRIWQRKNMTTNAPHLFKAMCTSTSSMPYSHHGALLNVTYTYDEATTSRVMNSLMLAAADEVGYPGGTSSADMSRFKRALSIPDANPTLETSGILCSYIDAAAVTTNIRVGNQAFTAYTNVATVVCGGFMFYHNFDASSRNGKGVSLSPHGEFTLDFYTTSATAGSRGTNFSALMYLNYSSDKSSLPGGSSNNPHTVIPWFCNIQATAALVTTITKQPIDIPEHDRWIMGLVPVLSSAGGVVTPFYQYFSAKLDTSTSDGAGWADLYIGTGSMDSEYAPVINFARARKEFRRWPYDSDNARMYLEKSRSFRFGGSSAATRFASYWPVTYHTLTTTVSGDVSGYTGNGAGINIHAFDDTFLKETIYEGSTNIGGSFSFPWYNPSINIYVAAIQDSTHKGVYYGNINSSANINFGSVTMNGIPSSWVF